MAADVARLPSHFTLQADREQRGRVGGRDFRRVIVGEVAGAIASGEMDKALSQRFGVGPRPVRR